MPITHHSLTFATAMMLLAVPWSYAADPNPNNSDAGVPEVTTPRTQLDDAGLPKGRFSMLEVLFLSSTFTRDRQQEFQLLYSAKTQKDKELSAKLGEIFLAELTDYPELVKCGLQGAATPIALDSHDQQIERMRAQAYAQLAGYVSPVREVGASREHTLQYYREQESRIIDQINTLQFETDAKVKGLLTSSEREQLEQVRSTWNRQAKQGFRNTAPVVPSFQPQTRTKPPNHNFTSHVDLKLVTPSNFITDVASGTSKSFSSGDQEADSAASWALSGGVFKTPRPADLPVKASFDITFDYK